jgi:hypothetical protein
MFEYKIHTQRDKTFSGAFDPTEFEAALNAHAADGWRLAEGFMVLQPLEEHEERDRAHPRAAPPYHRPSDMSRTPTGRRRSTIAASHVARTTPTGGMKPADIDRPIFRSD